MTDLQEQVVLGAILGGSSLCKQPKGKNYYLSMRSNRAIWLQYKIAELHNYFNSSVLSKQKNTYRCNSVCSPEFTNLYNLLYQDGNRHVSETLFDKMQDMAMAIWFVEGGGWAGRNRKNAYLNTTMFGDSGSQITQNYFNNILNVPCNINKNKSRRRLLFTISGTLKLWSIIEARLPNFYLDSI